MAEPLVLNAGSGVTMKAGASEPARVGLVGGETMDGPRYLSWSLISSSAERIEPAKDDWRFAEVPGEADSSPCLFCQASLRVTPSWPH